LANDPDHDSRYIKTESSSGGNATACISKGSRKSGASVFYISFGHPWEALGFCQVRQGLIIQIFQNHNQFSKKFVISFLLILTRFDEMFDNFLTTFCTFFSFFAHVRHAEIDFLTTLIFRLLKLTFVTKPLSTM
jgi:hypothetical protein